MMGEPNVTIVKPSSIKHADEKENRTCIYCLDLHPSEPWKLATGGLDTKIRIWDIQPYLQASDRHLPPTEHEFLLSTLSLHNGAIMCLRFSRDGRYLASGSDGDNIIIIWERDNTGYKGAVLGSKDVNREPWRCVKRLTGHNSDVVDLAWSYDFNYLASCGLDNSIIVWNTETFERVKRLEAHQGFVKGVSWDPVGKYLTSQADDRSVIFWNTFDWTVAKQVHEGFEKSGGQTFYKRHSWAPDGSQVCFVHAVDESRFQNVALIVDRETLSDSVSLVGSRSLVECSAYNPKLFASLSTSSAMNGDREGGNDDMITDESVQHYCLCAIGSQEGTLSLWQQNNPRASLVLENAFHGPIYDMTWSPDGLCLAACSGDSTITLLLIEQQKLSVGPRQLSLTAFGALLDTKRTEAALMRYGFQPGLKKALKNKADLIESASLLDLINEERARNVDVGGEGDMDIDLNKDGDVEARSGDGFRVDRDTHQKLKDRMGGSQGGEGFSQPLLSVPGSTAVVGADGKKRVQPILLSSISSSPLSQTQTVTTTKDGRRRVQPISLIPATPSPSKSILASSSLSQHQNQHLQSQQGTVEDYRIPPKPLALPMAKLKQSQSLDFSPHGKVIIENPVGNMRVKFAELTFVCENVAGVQWTDYLLSQIIGATVTENFVAVFCKDSTIVCWSHMGRRLLPRIISDSPMSMMQANSEHLIYVSTKGTIWSWNILKQTCILNSVALSPLISKQQQPDDELNILSLKISKWGLPIVTLSNHKTFTFHAGLKSWVAQSEVIEHDMEPVNGLDFISASDLQTRSIPRAKDTPAHILKAIGASNQELADQLELSSLEEKIALSITVKDQQEFRKCFQLYGRRLALKGESVKSKCIEMMEFLAGPYRLSLQSKSGGKLSGNEREEDGMILGISKLELLKEFLILISPNKSIQRDVLSFKQFLDR